MIQTPKAGPRWVRILDWFRWRRLVQVNPNKWEAEPRRYGHWLLWIEEWRIRHFLRETEQWEKLDKFKGLPRGQATKRTIETSF